MKRNPFTPGLPIDPEHFIGRKQEIDIFKKSLTQSFFANPQNLAIIGDRGIGKSSLLRKFESIAEKKGCLVVRREVDASVNSLQTLSYFILTAIKSEGNRFFSKPKKVKDKVSRFFKKYKVGIAVAGFGGSLEEKKPQIAVQEDFFNELSEISENVGMDIPSIVIMLDEAEHLQSIDGAWGFIRSVFTRLLEKKHNYLIVVSGKLNLFKNIKEIFSPMERFFFPKEIGNLNKEETIEAIEKPLTENNVSISNEVKNLFAEFTDGHPFVIQVFGYYLFELGEKTIDLGLFNEELPRILDRLRVQVFQDRYYSASPSEKKILDYMANSTKTVFRPTEIKKHFNFKNPRTLMSRLVKKDCLRKKGVGKYMLYHKLFKSYILNENKKRGV